MRDRDLAACSRHSATESCKDTWPALKLKKTHVATINSFKLTHKGRGGLRGGRVFSVPRDQLSNPLGSSRLMEATLDDHEVIPSSLPNSNGYNGVILETENANPTIHL